MRKLLAVLFIAALVFGCNQTAEARHSSTSVEGRKTAVGAGTDTPLWKHSQFDIDLESRYDWNNGIDDGGTSFFVVFKPKLDKGIFQIAGDKIRDLIN